MSFDADEKEVLEAIEKGDNAYLIQAFRYQASLVEIAERQAAAWQHEALQGLSEQLVDRLVRLRRFYELQAPAYILVKEQGMVMESIGEFVGDPNPRDFCLPAYNKTRGEE